MISGERCSHVSSCNWSKPNVATSDRDMVRPWKLKRSVSTLVVSGLARPTKNEAVPAVMRGTGDRSAVWDVKAPAGRSNIAIDQVLRLSSLVMVRDAVRVGAGRLPISLVSHDLAAGTLVHWGDAEGPDIALGTLYPSRRLLSAPLSAFLEFLKGAFPMGTPEELAAFIKG